MTPAALFSSRQVGNNSPMGDDGQFCMFDSVPSQLTSSKDIGSIPTLSPRSGALPNVIIMGWGGGGVGSNVHLASV